MWERGLGITSCAKSLLIEIKGDLAMLTHSVPGPSHHLNLYTKDYIKRNRQ
jgi:hypothetical protein